MISSRRQSLQRVNVPAASHAGLWLDKFMTAQLQQDDHVAHGQTPPTQQHVAETAGISMPEAYRAFYERWAAAMQTSGATTAEAAVKGRMAVGLGDESVLETSVTLHRTYGVPYIPGSALKGLAASYARQRLDPALWGAQTAGYRTLFGETEKAGYVTFFDALYLPGSGHQGKALHADVIAVHHPKYYQGGQEPPADWDNPTMVPFLSATGRYLVALAGPPDWVQTAFAILELALNEIGVGAKTSSGYGRLTLHSATSQTDPVPQPVPLQTAPDQAPTPALGPGEVEVAALIQQVLTLSDSQVAPQIMRYVERWRALKVSDALKRKAAEAILAKVKAAGREKASRDKPWYQELEAFGRP